ncbi:MAG: iron-containing alcohol dehydrogenase [Spirochaetes bacterium]|nr:iron-containing alcohol dehydrogenase [Spirochaetota bacterium]
MSYFEFTLPTMLTFGNGAFSELGRISKKYGKRALIITNGQTLSDTGIIDETLKQMHENNINTTVFDDVTSESDSNQADLAANIARFGTAELIIAVGGFRTMNIGKAAATVVTNGGESSDYVNGQKITNQAMPLITVPTIPGTLAELTSGFCVLDKYDKVNKEMVNPMIHPAECIIDPKLHLTIPSKFLATSAIAIFGYAFEVFISRQANAISDSLALRAMELVVQNLKHVVESQSNLQYRLNMGMASILGSIAVNGCSTGALRAFALAANSQRGINPGVAVTVMLPSIMEYNITSAAARFVQIARIFGEDVSDISVLEAAIKSVENMRRYLSEFNLPTRLSEIGIESKHFKQLAQDMLTFNALNTIPRPMGMDDIMTLLEQAY